MACLWVRRSGDKRSALGPHGEITFFRTFLYRSTVPNELHAVILSCGLLPVYGSPHPENWFATCTKIAPTQVKEDPYLWRVECEWSTLRPDRKNDADQQQKPESRRPKWHYRFVKLDRWFPRDYDGKLFASSAGTPFDPPPSLPLYADEITVTRYEPIGSRQTQAAYLNATNTDNWLYAGPNEALVDDINVEEVFEWNAWYWLCTYKLLICPRVQVPGNSSAGSLYFGGFNPLSVLDAGPQYLDSNQKLQPCTAGGYVDGRPTLLDGYGHQAQPTPGTWPSPPGPPTPYYLSFRTVNTIAYAPLNLVPPDSATS